MSKRQPKEKHWLDRDYNAFSRTKEGKKIINSGKIFVNGVVKKDIHCGVGLMDVISIPDVKRHFRAMPSRNGLELKVCSFRRNASFDVAL